MDHMSVLSKLATVSRAIFGQYYIPISSLSDLSADFWIDLLSCMFKFMPEATSSMEDQVQILIDHLGFEVLRADLSHIRAGYLLGNHVVVVEHLVDILYELLLLVYGAELEVVQLDIPRTPSSPPPPPPPPQTSPPSRSGRRDMTARRLKAESRRNYLRDQVSLMKDRIEELERQQRIEYRDARDEILRLKRQCQ